MLRINCLKKSSTRQTMWCTMRKIHAKNNSPRAQEECGKIRGTQRLKLLSCKCQVTEIPFISPANWMRSDCELSPAVVILFLVPYISALCCSFFRHAPLSAAFYCPRRRRNNSVKCARFLQATFYRFRILSLSPAHSAQLWSRVCVAAAIRILEINAACSAAQFLLPGGGSEF